MQQWGNLVPKASSTLIIRKNWIFTEGTHYICLNKISVYLENELKKAKQILPRDYNKKYPKTLWYV